MLENNNNQLTYEKLEPELQTGFGLVDFVRVLFKRWPTILSFFFATVITVLLLSLMFSTPLYRTEAKLLLEIGKEHIFDPTLLATDAGRPIVKYNSSQQTALASEILQGHYLLNKVIRKVGYNTIYNLGDLPDSTDGNTDQEILIEKAIIFLQEDMEVTSLPDSSFLNVSFENENPEVAAEVVNSLISLFVDRHLSIRKDEEKRKFYKEQASLLVSKLQENEKALQEIKQENGILSSLPEEKRMLIEQQMKLDSVHGETLIKIQEVIERITQLQSQIGETSDNPKALATLNSRLLELQLEERELLSNYNSKSRVVRNIRAQINSTQAKINKLGKGKRYGNTPSADGSLYERLQEELLKQDVELNALRATGQAQKTQLEQYRNKIINLDKMENALDRQEEQIQIDQKNYKIFLSKYEQTRISNAMDEEGITSIRIIEPAYVPNRPIDRKRSLALLISMIFGLIGGIGLAYLLELLGPTIDTKKDVERYLGATVLAIVPENLLAAPE